MIPPKILIIASSLLTLLVAATPVVAYASHQHHHKSFQCKPPYSILYVYTFPETKECVLLTHYGKVVNATGVPIK